MSEFATYREIKADILRRITSGYWPQGALLPGEHALAAEYQVARATVSRALRELADAGIVERRRKIGTRVRPRPLREARIPLPLVRAEIEGAGDRYGYRLLSAGTEPAADQTAVRLEVPPGTPLLHVLCLHSAGARAHQLEDRWINPAMVPGVSKADFSASGPAEWLTRAVPFTQVDLIFSSAAASEAEAELLVCAPGDALFVMERTTALDGQPVSWVRLYHGPGFRLATRY